MNISADDWSAKRVIIASNVVIEPIDWSSLMFPEDVCRISYIHQKKFVIHVFLKLQKQ